MRALQVLRFLKEEQALRQIGSTPDAGDSSGLRPDCIVSGRLVPIREDGWEYDAEKDWRSELWVPTHRSTGTRQPTPRTKAHCRGWLVDPTTCRSVGFSSTHELRVAALLMANRAVVEVEDQPPAIKYLGVDGRWHHHTFDFRATYSTGYKIAIAVKPKTDLEKSGIRQVLKRVRADLDDFADEAIVLTDEAVTIARGWNALSILRARRARNDEDCARMRAFFKGVHGAIHASHATAQFNDQASALNAIWCLIYDGVLKLIFPDRKLVDAPFVANAMSIH